MFQRILVPLDGSELAENALPVAFRLAKNNRSDIILIRVPVLGDIAAYASAAGEIPWQEEIYDTGYQNAQEYLHQIERRHDQPGMNIKTEIIAGDPASTIVDYARTENIDMIVMCTHGRTGISRWVLGSTTEKVMRHAHCPVFVVRSEDHIKHLLITLDGSELAESAVPVGIAVAHQLNTKLSLLSVESPPDAEILKSAAELEHAEPGLGDRLIDGAYHRLENYLNNYVRAHHVGEILPEKPTIEVIEGSPATTILDYAESQDVDLIVMATHGRTGLRRWMFGSVTEKVLHNTKAAMLIVRPPAETLK